MQNVNVIFIEDILTHLFMELTKSSKWKLMNLNKKWLGQPNTLKNLLRIPTTMKSRDFMLEYLPNSLYASLWWCKSYGLSHRQHIVQEINVVHIPCSQRTFG
jgi:hypothetical protein